MPSASFSPRVAPLWRSQARRLTVLAAVVALAGGCGGGDGGGGADAARYHREADGACVQAYRAVSRLPQQVHDEQLTVAQAEARADDIGRRFVATLTGLEPPEALRARHDALVAVLRRPFANLDDRETIARVSDLERRYRALGLERCADQETRSLSQLKKRQAGGG